MPSQPASTFRLIPICWLLTVDSEMGLFLFHSLAEGVLVLNSCGSREIHGEFQSKFQSKNGYGTHRFVFHAILVYSIKFTMEFTS